jgi:hypothetical protein
MNRIVAKCYMKLADWHSSLFSAPISTSIRTAASSGVVYPTQASDLLSPSSMAHQQYLWQLAQRYFLLGLLHSLNNKSLQH